jgi:hypothetical protein
MSLYARGKDAFGFCDQCGFRYPFSELKYQIINQRNTRLKVCPECNDEDHPQLQLGRMPVLDPQGLFEPRPDGSLGTIIESLNSRLMFSFNPVGANMPPMISGCGQVRGIGTTVNSPPDWDIPSSSWDIPMQIWDE